MSGLLTYILVKKQSRLLELHWVPSTSYLALFWYLGTCKILPWLWASFQHEDVCRRVTSFLPHYSHVSSFLPLLDPPSTNNQSPLISVYLPSVFFCMNEKIFAYSLILSSFQKGQQILHLAARPGKYFYQFIAFPSLRRSTCSFVGVFPSLPATLPWPGTEVVSNLLHVYFCIVGSPSSGQIHWSGIAVSKGYAFPNVPPRSSEEFTFSSAMFWPVFICERWYLIFLNLHSSR